MAFDAYPAIENQIYTGQLSAVSSLTSVLSLWLQGAQQELMLLDSMTEGWDSYGSPPISAEARKKMADLLHEFARVGMSRPELFPVSGGGLQVEWKNGGRELEIEVLPNADLEYLIIAEDGKMKEGKAIQEDIFRLARWFREGEAKVMDS